MLTNKARLIKAAFAHSEEFGEEVEALAQGSADPRTLRRLRINVKREFGEDADLVYETIVPVLFPSD